MGKKLKYAAIGLILLLGGGFLVITLTIDSIVQSNIEKIGSEMTGTRVTADDVSISLFSGEGTITGFRVANPDGFTTEHALVVNDFSIKMDIPSLLSDEITVKEVVVNSPAVYVEQRLTGNNLRTILKTMKKAEQRSKDPEAEPSSEPSSESSSETGFVVERFVLVDGSVNFHTTIGGEQSGWVKMSEIELHDLGRANGKQVAEQVVVKIADEIVAQALKAGVKSGAKQVQDAIKEIFK